MSYSLAAANISQLAIELNPPNQLSRWEHWLIGTSFLPPNKKRHMGRFLTSRAYDFVQMVRPAPERIGQKITARLALTSPADSFQSQKKRVQEHSLLHPYQT